MELANIIENKGGILFLDRWVFRNFSKDESFSTLAELAFWGG